MKKNISINISGIIFHIEEDGYDKLKNYLESINRYFSTFEDSLEIISDIETRIAEIFLSKLKEGKQVITPEDVDVLIATMGSIKDFQAAEEESGFTSGKEAESEENEVPEEPLFAKKLYRDNSRKLLAGVLSGIAFYFNTDPLWIRLAYVLLFFGVSILPSVSGFLFLAYIVLWIVVPASDELKEKKKIKKMYRDPDTKVLGGVAGGIAAYFGVDVVIIRLLFFVSIFVAGTGLILYIILWIILPEAKTLTDKMEMQGQPVTLSNIESNIKKSLNVQDGDENIFVKILLFPFRLIGAFFEFLSHALGPFMAFLVEALRVVFGALLAIIGLSGVLAVLIAAGVLIGLVTGGDLNVMYPLPFELIKYDVGVLPGIAMTFALIIPAFYLTILGFMILMKKKVLNSKASWSILALWLISIIILSFTIPSKIRNFQDDGRFTDVERYDLNGETVVLHFNDIGEDEFDLVRLNIRSHQDSIVKMEKEFRATGPSRTSAVENAKNINYVVMVQDSVFTFDSMLSFKEKTGFRKQEVEVNLFLPEGLKFVMDEDMKYLIGSFLFREGYSDSDIEGNVWTFKNSELVCLSCPAEDDEEFEISDEQNLSGYTKDFDIQDFNEVDISSAFKVNITQGDDYNVIVNGRKSYVDDVLVEKRGSLISFDFKGNISRLKRNKENIVIYITMPELSALELGGASKVYVDGFTQDYMDIGLHGAAYAALNIEVSSVEADIDGASKLDLNGTGDLLKAKVSGASTLNAFNFMVSETELEANSAATARVYANDRLYINSNGASNVSYRGDANIEINKGGGSSVNKD